MRAVVPTEPVPRLVILAALADFVAGAIYGVLGGWIVAVGLGASALPDGYAVEPAVAWLVAPTGVMLAAQGALLVFTGVQLIRGREWVRPVQWMLSILLGILALVGILRGHDALCPIKLVCAVIPMLVLPRRAVRAWFDSPYVRIKRPRSPLVAVVPHEPAERAGSA